MEVDVKSARYTADHDGATYYFCSRGCQLDFQEDPTRFLDPDYTPSM